MQLQDRVRRYVWSCNTDLPYDARGTMGRGKTEGDRESSADGHSNHLRQQRMNSRTTPQLRGRRMSDDDLPGRSTTTKRTGILA